MEHFKFLIIILASLSIAVRAPAARSSSRAGQVAPFIEKSLDEVTWTVISANLGRGLELCNGPIGDFMRHYVLLLSKAVEVVLDGILLSNQLNKGSVFIDQLRPLLVEVQDLLRLSNKKIDKKEIEWVTIIKQISYKFQKAAITFVNERLDADPKDIVSIKKKVVQKLIIAIILVENKFENELCNEHKVCIKEHECTMALKTVLGEFTKANDEKAKDFMTVFNENVPIHLFSFLKSETYQRFKKVLSDLSDTLNPPTKDALLTVLKTVEARLELLNRDVKLSKAHTQQLGHVILADMDYIYYSKKKRYPFDSFIVQFTGWMIHGGSPTKFGWAMRAVVENIKEKLSLQPPELVNKLMNQLRILIELTVDPV